MISVHIAGLQAAQAANQRAIASASERGALGRAVKYATTELQRFAISITHVWHVKGGALRASQRMDYDGRTGRLFIDPQARNPRTGRRVVQYAFAEHARGGSHAFYARTFGEAGPRIARAAVDGIVSSL